MTVTPRTFAAILGALMALAGIIALSIPITAAYDSGLFGDATVRCGSAFATESLGGDALAACDDAVGDRRAWGWPLLIAGAVALAGAAFISSAGASRPEPADSND